MILQKYAARAARWRWGIAVQCTRDQKEIQAQIARIGLRAQLPHIDSYQPVLCTFYRGEVVCGQQQPLPYLYIVTLGQLMGSIAAPSGGAVSYLSCGPGDMAGELELISGGCCMAQMQATCRTRCLRIDLGVYRDTVRQDQAMLRLICQNLAHKLAATAQSSTQNLLLPLPQRLAGKLLAGQKDGIYCQNLSRLALIMGVSYRHLLRCLSQMVERGLLQRAGRGRFLLVDPDALRRLADGVRSRQL
nr:cyclic nucleotide-binding domain-containing protein [Neobittarella massiliensis]